MDKPEKISEKRKMAILLGVLPIEVGKEIVNGLNEEEKKIIADEIRDLEKSPVYSENVTMEIVREFVENTGNDKIYYRKGPLHLMNLMEGTMNNEEYQKLIQEYAHKERPLDFLKQISDITPWIPFLKIEDVQTIAVIASYFKPTQAAQLLESLPKEKRTKVAKRIANMGKINQKMLKNVEKFLNEKRQSFNRNDNNQTDGLKNIVNIINNVNRPTEREIFEKLEVEDPELAKKIKENMFVFEDLTILDEKDLILVFSKISENELIAKAVKKTTTELKDRIYNSMAKGRVEMIKDIEEHSKYRIKEVEEAQQAIANRVKELEKANEITLPRGDQDIVI